MSTRANAAAPAEASIAEAAEIAVEAYLYAYPLVLMDITRRLATNVESPAGTRCPMNQFAHLRVFPDATFTDVVRPNADTLYSSLWFDVSKEPLVISVPDSGGRYYLLPMLDLWTDVFASPGKRTTGTSPQKFAIVGPTWLGKLPPGVELLRAPTVIGWILGRTQTNGKSDYHAVHKFQAELTATPLSAFGESYNPPKGTVDPAVSPVAPVEQVSKMDAPAFFTRFCELTKNNPPHANDYPILGRMKRIGIVPGQSFDLARTTPAVKTATAEAGPKAMAKLKSYFPDRVVNSWVIPMNPIGTYGTDYLRRANIAYFGLGANCVEDAIYPSMLVQFDGRPFDSGKKYVLHFKKEEIPPARAFWSLTLYNDRQLFTDNPINRYAIGDRDPLSFNADRSLDLYIQRDSPSEQSNWLPSPKKGAFSLTMRLYWPMPAALDGTWKPPEIHELR